MYICTHTPTYIHVIFIVICIYIYICFYLSIFIAPRLWLIRSCIHGSSCAGAGLRRITNIYIYIYICICVLYIYIYRERDAPISRRSAVCVYLCCWGRSGESPRNLTPMKSKMCLLEKSQTSVQGLSRQRSPGQHG